MCRFNYFKLDELVKSRPEAMFINYHDEHEAENIIYFLLLRVLRALRSENQTFYGLIKLDTLKVNFRFL
jgi:hypothetical protein